MKSSPTSRRLSIHGAGGRMGRQLIAAVAERSEARLVAGLEAPGHPCIGQDAGILGGGPANGVTIGHELADVCALTDTLIDFSAPAATLDLLDCLSELPAAPALVIGTTGFDKAGIMRIETLAARIPIVFAANYSVGITLVLSLLEQAAAVLDESYDIEISEAHHRHKVDAPSGTALAMAESIARTRGVELDAVAVHERKGITGARKTGSIGFSVVRAGEIVGEHTALFAGNGERIEITHRAVDRMTFARGAVRAALWLDRQPPGLYDMSDVLGLASLKPSGRQA